MKAALPDIQEYLETLADTPPRLAAASRSVDKSRLYFKPDSKSWSASDILAHLRACADVWGASIESMLTTREPTLPDIHPRQHLKQTDYRSLNFFESLQAFSHQRGKLLQILDHLEFEDWSRAALIGGRRHTVFTQARRMAGHELEHCTQIEFLLTNNRE